MDFALYQKETSSWEREITMLQINAHPVSFFSPLFPLMKQRSHDFNIDNVWMLEHAHKFLSVLLKRILSMLNGYLRHA